jgi:glucoamylase
MKMIKKIPAALIFLLPFLALANPCSKLTLKNEELTQWLSTEQTIAESRMLENISRPDTVPGTVVAATTKVDPNYYYHWVRDAGMVMEATASLYTRTVDPILKAQIRQKLIDFARLSRRQQMTLTKSAWSGDPKFQVDGTAFDGPWGRPQTDGPPLRLIALKHIADILIEEGEINFVRQTLYDGLIPTESVIKGDLEYTAHHWRDSSFEIWEEVKGEHFFTYMVSRKALIVGAELAQRLGDGAAADFYLAQAREIESEILTKFWNPEKDLLIPTVNRVEGLDYKHSDLDTSVILGLLHGSLNDGFLPFSDPKVQSTLNHLIESFRQSYPVNQRADVAGVAIGRYPEDVYAGNNFDGGNPWVLTTFAVAESYYRAAIELKAAGRFEEAQVMLDRGDEFSKRVQYHSPADGSLSEQIDKTTGFMTSVENLTWSYASSITAAVARAQAAQ